MDEPHEPDRDEDKLSEKRVGGLAADATGEFNNSGKSNRSKSSQLTIGSLAVAIIVAAIYFSILRYAFQLQSPLLVAISSLITFVLILFAVYAFSFLLVLPIGLLERYSEQVVAVPDSPFANDRLPEQQVSPHE